MFANIEKQYRNEQAIFIVTSQSGLFAEFKDIDQLTAYLDALGVNAFWKGPPDEMPTHPRITLWENPA